LGRPKNLGLPEMVPGECPRKLIAAQNEEIINELGKNERKFLGILGRSPPGNPKNALKCAPAQGLPWPGPGLDQPARGKALPGLGKPPKMCPQKMCEIGA